MNAAAARIDELKKRYDENPRRFFAPLANEYRKAGDLEQAIALCQQHLAEQPGNMNGHVVYGQALFESGRYDEAATTFETALTLDPENLIALRHLGDIARTHGDNQKARAWYTRVLDADPRNEEIIAFLAEIDTAFLAEPATVVAEAAPAPVPDAAPALAPDAAPALAPDAAPALAPDAAPAPVAAAPSTPLPPPLPPPEATAKPESLGDAITLQIVAQRPSPRSTPRVPTPPAAATVEQDADVGARTIKIESAATPAAAQPVVPPPTPIAGVAPPPRPSLDLMDISDFGAEAEETPSPVFGEPAAAAMEPPAGMDPFGDMGFGDALEAPPAHDEAPDQEPIGGGQQSADVDAFADLDFSMGGSGARHSAAQPEEPEEDSTQVSSAAEPVTAGYGDLDLPSAEPAAAQDADAVAAPEATVHEEPPPADPASFEAPARASAADVAAVGETPKAFVTETMAELYLRQGFRVEALGVYRQLVDENPLEQKFRDRLRQLEREDRSTPQSSGAVTGSARRPSPVAGGATVRPAITAAARTAREFFASLASRRALRRDGTPPTGTAAPGILAPAPDGAVPPRVSSGGSLDTLFGSTEVAPGDEHLALAFARVGEAVDPGSTVKGKPTQPAQSEVSLEHLFRDTPARASKAVPRQSEKLRFDQFFTPASGAATDEPPRAAPPAGEPGSPAELEQFQDWLQQLKKP